MKPSELLPIIIVVGIAAVVSVYLVGYQRGERAAQNVSWIDGLKSNQEYPILPPEPTPPWINADPNPKRGT